MSIEIVSATSSHVRSFGHNMREEDQREIRALGLEPHHGLWRSYRTSFIRKTIFVDGVIAAMFGCGGCALGNEGYPWFLTGPQVEKTSPLVFAFLYRQETKKLLQIFPVLVNWVHSKYSDSIRLMKLIGFKAVEEKPLGPFNEMFSKMEIRCPKEYEDQEEMQVTD